MLPLLVYATRTAAVCKSPTPLVLATIVVLVYVIVSTLQRLADQREYRRHSATRQYVAAAHEELGGHQAVLTAIRGERHPVAQAVVQDPSVAGHDEQQTPSSKRDKNNLIAAKVKSQPSGESSRGRTR